MNKRVLLLLSIIFIPIIFMVIITGNLTFLILGILLLCPLMHIFGHNHSSHSNKNKANDKDKRCH